MIDDLPGAMDGPSSVQQRVHATLEHVCGVWDDVLRAQTIGVADWCRGNPPTCARLTAAQPCGEESEFQWWVIEEERRAQSSSSAL
jgi:hypothetical protein